MSYTSSQPHNPKVNDASRAQKSIMLNGILLGIGLMGAIDTIIFHQFLQWHNFYIHTTQYWRIVSDGLIHTLTATLLFVGAVRIWQDRRQLLGTNRYQLAGAILLGMGSFQVFDGVIFHMVLQIHPVREGVANQLPYDFAWNATGVAIFVLGWIVWRRSR
jgi:uncharacterized membrane protein